MWKLPRTSAFLSEPNDIGLRRFGLPIGVGFDSWWPVYGTEFPKADEVHYPFIHSAI